jgi:hypothetical protein
MVAPLLTKNVHRLGFSKGQVGITESKHAHKASGNIQKAGAAEKEPTFSRFSASEMACVL